MYVCMYVQHILFYYYIIGEFRKMSCSCNGICNRYLGYSGNPKYDLGYRYCATCSYSILGDMLLCPCCKTTLRRKPRHKEKIHV